MSGCRCLCVHIFMYACMYVQYVCMYLLWYNQESNQHLQFLIVTDAHVAKHNFWVLIKGEGVNRGNSVSSLSVF